MIKANLSRGRDAKPQGLFKREAAWLPREERLLPTLINEEEKRC